MNTVILYFAGIFMSINLNDFPEYLKGVKTTFFKIIKETYWDESI